MRTAAFSLPLAFATLFAAHAAVAITQPDGTPIPSNSDLQRIFDAEGDPVNAMSDAAIVPETFSPGCRLTFTLVSRGAALFQDAFGWYNVTGGAPALSDLHVLIPCNAPSGFVATLDLAHEPGYTGGEIGFFLRTPQESGSGSCAGGDCCATATHPGYTYYSERRFNPDSLGPATSYIHLLTYNSRTTPRAFYFAWEDLFNGGDNQFTDFVAQVGNIVCTGGGGSCDTGMQGICGQDTQQCRVGALTCVPANQPRAESCNGLDDDCNGSVDDGSELCGASRICDRGTCVDRCVEGSCFEGFTCTSEGRCVENACVGMNCPSGERCVAGACVTPCDGITCPAGLQCRVGACIDPCAGVTCDAEQVCVLGVCQPRCDCTGCASGEACGADGRCVPSACAAMTCAAGQVCTATGCVDACAGAVCPRGEMCTSGECVPASTSDGGLDAAADVAAADVGSDVTPDAGGADADASDGTMRDASSNDAAGFTRPPPGCRCAVPAGSRSAHGLTAIVLVAALTAAQRRRARERVGSS
jgi:hypothetical protein